MKQRIRLSQNFVNNLLGYKKKHTRSKIFCARFLYKEEGRYGRASDVPSYRLYIRVRIPVYILMLPFVLLFQFFYYAWDGGLKTFTWPSPEVDNRRIFVDDHSMYFECTNKWIRETED